MTVVSLDTFLFSDNNLNVKPPSKEFMFSYIINSASKREATLSHILTRAKNLS